MQIRSMQPVNLAGRSKTKPPNLSYKKSKQALMNADLHNVRGRDKAATLKLPQEGDADSMIIGRD